MSGLSSVATLENGKFTPKNAQSVLSACVAAYAHVAEEWHVRDGYALGTTLD